MIHSLFELVRLERGRGVSFLGGCLQSMHRISIDCNFDSVVILQVVNRQP